RSCCDLSPSLSKSLLLSNNSLCSIDAKVKHFFKDVSPAYNPHLELVKHFFKDVRRVECYSPMAIVQIPKGARFVGIPGTESSEHPRGLMVEVYWGQDDTGTLCISGHSPETDVPPIVQLTVNRAHLPAETYTMFLWDLSSIQIRFRV
ncbi:hypothetical protein B296_00003904, partial [Ensete ventricosum]